MAAVLNSAVLQLLFSASQSVANDLGNALFQPSLNKKLEFSNGVGSGQADLLFTDERTVGISSNDDIDLAGVLSDVAGQTITAVEMVALAIVADSTNVNSLSVGGGSNPWISSWLATGDGIKVPPNGLFVIGGYDAAGLGAVVAATGDILRIANGAGTTSKYKIIILARTA